MKRKIVVAVVAFIIVACAYLAYIAYNKQKEKEKKLNIIQHLPDKISLITTNNTLFTRDSLFPFQNVCFIFFNSTCEHCKNQINEMHTRRKRFHDILLLFITNENVETLKKFSKESGMNEIENSRILIDINSQCFSLFGVYTTRQS